MRWLILRSLVSVLLLTGGAAPLQASAESNVSELRSFLSVPPRARLDAALAANDRRFLGVRGYTLELPGVPETETSRVTENGVLSIPGTSDALLSEEHAQLNSRARAYAEEYNSLLLRHLAHPD